MMQVIQLHLWLMDKRGTWTEPEVIKTNKKTGESHEAPGRRIVIEPSGPSIVQMKMDVAKTLRPYLGKIEYYYVVAVVEKSDGTPGYRTIVPKTLVV